MEPIEIDDETLMAYADGELDADTMAQVEAALAQSEDVAQRLAMFFETRSLLQEAYAPRLADPVPDALVAAIRGQAEAQAAAPAQGAGSVVSLDRHRQARDAATSRATPAWRPAAIAASLALAVGLGAGWMLGSGSAPSGGAGLVASLDHGAMREALVSLPSGERLELSDGGAIAAIATFRNTEGQLCREMENDSPAGATLVSVLCHEGSGWDLRFAVAASGGADGYAPASSLETLDTWLERTGASEPLSLEDEAEALIALK